MAAQDGKGLTAFHPQLPSSHSFFVPRVQRAVMRFHCIAPQRDESEALHLCRPAPLKLEIPGIGLGPCLNIQYFEYSP